MKFNTIIIQLSILIYVCFLYSGLMKWISFIPFDTTLVFGGLSILVLAYTIIFEKFYALKHKVVVLTTISILFLWVLFACTYTVSQHYYLYKLLQFFLVVTALIYPIIVFRTKTHIDAFLFSITLVGFISIILILILYNVTNGDLRIYYTFMDPKIFGDKALPDYLAIGELLMVFILTNQNRNSIFMLGIKAIAILSMIWLAGRGPIVALVLLLIIDFLLKFKFNFKSIFSVFLLAVTIPIILAYLLSWEGSEIVQERFNPSGGDANHGVTARIYMYQGVSKAIEDEPFLGIGFGGFGQFLYAKDMRAYPHNMFLEIFCETGIFGFFLLFFLIGYFFVLPLRKFLFSDEMKNTIYYGIALACLALFLQTLKASALSDLRIAFGFMGVVISTWYIVEAEKLSIDNSKITSDDTHY